jgi:hypothetical protein
MIAEIVLRQPIGELDVIAVHPAPTLEEATGLEPIILAALDVIDRRSILKAMHDDS